MDWGLANRMARILRPSTGRTVMLAIDHGYFLGPTSGLEEPARTIAPLLDHADSLMLTRGVLRRCVPPDRDVPIVLRVSGGVSILRELSHEGLTVAVEDAVRLNASAMTMSVFVGAEGERESLVNLGKLIDAGERHGIPVLAVTAVGRDMVRDARYLGLACRISAEQGAHMVKTYWCDGFEEVVRATPVPIVVAGGKKVGERDAIRLAWNAVRDGACGVDMGRNIFQSDCPAGMIRAVRAVVHEGAGVDDAYDLYAAAKGAGVA
jgi:putative autoinducer-2 (AI-2) aldolase